MLTDSVEVFICIQLTHTHIIFLKLQSILHAMEPSKKIKSALISVYHKDNLEPIIRKLHEHDVKLYATGGTQDFIEKLNIQVTPVEDLTQFPSILGGRVKTLHPRIFGGILNRRENVQDLAEMDEFHIPNIDLVIIDLYPFEETLASGADESAIIEKIDIGGISLIRAAAKNFKDVLIIPSSNEYSFLIKILNDKHGTTSLDDRKRMAAVAFDVSSHYDAAIFGYFNKDENASVFKKSIRQSRMLRYGENPHQKGIFFGDFNALFDQLHGKEISYNNLLDIDAAIALMVEFFEPTIAIIKHNNACGIACGKNLSEVWTKALAGDPVSAFGGVIISNRPIDSDVAVEINKIFFEVLIAPHFDEDALQLLSQKKNRILLVQKKSGMSLEQFRTVLNGVVYQDRDLHTETKADMKIVTMEKPDAQQLDDMIFANKIVKHLKSNAIVLAKDQQMLGCGAGQTSRVDALQHAIAKAKHFDFHLHGAVMSSDAFFPFPDCVEIAFNAGIKTVVQPGGSVKDQESIDFCNAHHMVMAMTGYRHFRH
jgi:phosphoribosylaminoimidazolecarboxamide formyltransferase/IMP cyclohydrolase